MSTVMKRIFDLIEYKSGLELKKIAKQEDMTPQNLSRIKRDGLKAIRWLVELMEKYNLEDAEVMKCLRQEYGTKKTPTKKVREK